MERKGSNAVVKRAKILALLMLVLSQAPGCVLLGARSLDNSWSSLTSNFSVGVSFPATIHLLDGPGTHADAPFFWDMSAAWLRTFCSDAYIDEYFLGPAFCFGNFLMPGEGIGTLGHVSTGLDVVHGHVSGDGGDITVGGYVAFGYQLWLPPSPEGNAAVVIGLDIRYMFAEPLQFGGGPRDADGWNIALDFIYFGR